MTQFQILNHRNLRRLVLLTAIALLPSLAALVVVMTASADTGTGDVNLTTPGSPVLESFDTLATTGTTNTTLPSGWYLTEQGGGARDNEQYAADTGGSNTGDIYSFGAAGNTERALGGLRSGTLIPFFGARFANNTGVIITSVAISYTGEQWRLGTAARTDRIDFQISTNATDLTTGTYTDVDALDFTTPNTATIGAKDGNAAGNRTSISFTIGSLSIPNGATFFLRWIDLDATGADDGLSVDDFSLTPNPTVSTPPSGTGAASPSTVFQGASTQLTVTVTPGTNPPSTGITVNGDLALIGGSPAQPFFDDGVNGGDVTAGDNLFSFSASVPAATSPGSKSLPIAVSDDQPRTGSTSISLTVVANVTTLIHDIQGSAEAPNFNGSPVKITGIVVGDYQGGQNLSGFFVEEEASDWDADPTTSEGIFIFDGTIPATDVNVGNQVTVIGTVTNFPSVTAGLTELTNVSSVVVDSSGNLLPSIAALLLPVTTSQAADLERFEGMLVRFNQVLYVTDVDDLGRFGEVGVSANAPLYIPTNSIDPNDNPASGTNTSGNSNVPAVTAQQSLNSRSRIIINDGTSKSNTSATNPLNPIPFLLPSGTLRRGDSVSMPQGIMSFGFGNYRLEPEFCFGGSPQGLPPQACLAFTEGNPRPAAPALTVGSNLRIAAYNLENFFVTTGTGRGADNPTEFTRQRDKIVALLASLNADVIGLIELEKANGNSAAANVAAALTALGTAGTYAAVADLPTLNGTDLDIKNGMIYRTATVSPVGASFTDLSAPAGSYSRDPLAQMFTLRSNGRGFAVVVHHARSKSCPGSGLDDDLGDGQACFNDRRRIQSTLVANFVNGLTAPMVSDVLVVGDFNSYAEEDPIDVFRANGFTDAINQFVSADKKYSFTFNSETGQLDHAFATRSLATQLVGSATWHVNADEPAVIDYNTENKTPPQVDLYQPTPFRASDHDPIVADFNLALPTAANGIVSGRIATSSGAPVAGAVINLAGTQTRKTITDANGIYRFPGVETNGFYTVTPARANFSFSPANRSFSQLAERTEAAFTAAALNETINPLDTAEFFVRQQYVDLLGREPDEGGFNYWSEQILSCGNDASCLTRRRGEVAAAFFIEAEFQRTGAYLYGLYQGALGRQPVYQEFASDRQLVIDGPNLEQTKQLFAESFVTRSEFIAKYQGSTTAESFVAALLENIRQTSGVDLSDRREEFISRYNSGTSLAQSRALALRAMTESAAFGEAEYNPAFVLTEYFSYLLRDPDAGGYAFWLDVLNNRQAGNYRGMVCAFITSSEYQRRFASIVSRSDRDCHD